MKILELTLSGYRRFDLLGVNKITYTPESPYQLILGGNGIGKSSLLGELSPLPCESEDLKPEGYKIVKIEHRGSSYTLSYILHKKLDCSFVKDGVELNEGNTIKVQKDLILEHFHYDNNIHDLLVGFTKLSTMAPQQRREWFVKMSRSDMSYAIGLFNKLKSADRDIKGALKVNNQRIVNEQTKLPSGDDINRIKQENDTLKRELNHLLPYVERNLLDHTGELSQLGDAIGNLSAQMMDIKFNLKFEGIRDKTLLQQLFDQYKYEYQQHKSEFEKAVAELAELQEVYAKHQTLSNMSTDELNNRIFTVQQQLKQNNQESQRYTFNLGEDIRGQLDHYGAIKQLLTDVFTTMPVNPQTPEGNYLYTKKEYEQLMSKINDLTQLGITTKNRLGYHEREYENLNNIHDVNCPNCHTAFKPGIDCRRIEELQKCIEEDKRTLQRCQEEYKTLTDNAQHFQEWVNTMKRLRALQDEWVSYTPLFRYIHSLNIINDNPLGVIHHLNEYERALKLKEDYHLLSTRLVELETMLAKRLAAEGQDVEYIVHKMVKLEELTQQLKAKQAKLYEDGKRLSEVLADHDKLLSMRTTLQQHIDKQGQLTLEQIRYTNNKRLHDIISEKQIQLANNESFMQRLTQSETVINQLNQTNQQLEAEKKVLQVLLTLLSPQDGLIAESLIGFLNQFLNEMSNVLDQLWSYPMRLYMELGDEGVELDYRFKVDINDGASISKDVGKLSTGQKDAVDFVFKLLLMQHLDMQDYPLFMDEVGGTFDAYHRDRLYQYVKLLVESNQVQQVFIISHISSSHDALSTADRNVLDTDATMVDEQVNQVITFE